MNATSVTDSAASRPQGPEIIDSIINASSAIVTRVGTYKEAPSDIKKLGDFGTYVNGQLKDKLRNGATAMNDSNLDRQLKEHIDTCIIKLRTDLIAADKLLDKCIKKNGGFWKVPLYLIKVSKAVRSLKKQEKKFSLLMSSVDIYRRLVPSQLLLESDQFEIISGETAERSGIAPPRPNIFLVEGNLKNCEAGRDISGKGNFILEGRGYHHNGLNKLDNEKDIKTLASKLVKAGPYTGIPRLVGYRDAACRNSYELVFAIPSDLGRPRSLHSFLLDSAMRAPPLAYRFDICGQLAKAVLFTHNLNVVHKNIRPENLILLPPKDGNANTLDCQHFSTLFLVNWELVRDLADLTSFVGHDDWKRGIYQHPKRQGPRPEHEYTMGHDIYSLGICMLEIFLWRTFVEGDEVSQLYQERAIRLKLVGENFKGNTQKMIKKPLVVQKVLVDIAKTELPDIVGVSVASLVVKCLTIVENDFRGDNPLESETGVNHIQHILDVFYDLQNGDNAENDDLLPQGLPPLCRGNTKFRKVRYLGRGLLGDTWLVKSECHAKQQLVCKEIFYEDAVRREAVLKAIIQEYSLLEIPAHPKIVRFTSFECDKSKNRARIYMEYYDGEDLSSFIRDISAGERSLTEDTAWKIIFQMGAAVAYLHHGLAVDEGNRFFVKKSWKAKLHKNINPENVLLSIPSPDGEIIDVKLCNFGLDTLHAPIQLNGYEAPEIAQDDPKWSLKADIYSLGRTIEELSKNRGFEAINDLVRKCMSEAPENRPSSLNILEIAGGQIGAAIPNSSCIIEGWEKCMFSTIVSVGSLQTTEAVDQNQPIERLRLLMKDGCDLTITTKDSTGNTPLHVAAETGNLTLAQRLLELEVKVDTVNDNKQTALTLAAEKGDEKLMELLLRRNVNLEELKAIYNLATKYLNEGRLEEARRIFFQVMEVRRREFGKDHPDTLVVMEGLAATYKHLGKAQEAEDIYLQVKEARARAPGQSHPETVAVMDQAVTAYLQQGCTEEAGCTPPETSEARGLERALGENNECPHGWVRYNDKKFYKIKLLGRGAFGDAWLIRDGSDAEQLVCKEIFYENSDAGRREIVLKSIKQEHSLLEIAAHPNIVRFISFQSDESDHMARLYMEYCDGGDLWKFINDVSAGKKTLTLQIAWKIVFQLAAALAYLHHGLTIDVEKNCFLIEKTWKAILHRDIKPTNVLVSKLSGDRINVKLCDFGLGKQYVLELSGQGTYVGTVGYKAPEIKEMAPRWSMKADIYSFGRTIEKLSKNRGFEVIDDLVRECLSEVPENRPNSLKILEDAGRQIGTSPCNIQGSDDCVFSTIVSVGSIQTPEGVDQTQPIERLKLLMKDGCDLTMTTKDSTGNTPLHVAAEKGNLLLAQRLLELGVNVDAVNGNQRTASDLATEKGNELLRLLLDKGAR